jgi:hypothetical protein
MSGTPIFDNPSELEGLAGLMRINTLVTLQNIKTLFKNKVSYFPGAPEYTYPTVIKKIRHCIMSQHQAKWYKQQIIAEMKNDKIKHTVGSDDFYIKSRQKSNIVYPNGITTKVLSVDNIKNHLETYSTKMAKLVKSLKKNQLSFVYTGFTGMAGIAMIAHVLDVLGWRSIHVHGPGKRRYAIWSGEQHRKEKDMIVRTYNSVDNEDASQLQIIIGSPAIKEGVSLYGCRSVHIMETYWNHSRLEQIYGRAVRYCSHKRLVADERTVNIYTYAALTRVGSKEYTPKISIDLYMLDMADKKREECQPYMDALQQCAADYDKY